MTTNELKHKIINRIKKVDDDNLLNDLIKIIDDSALDSEVYNISDDHKNAIHKAINQIENGDYLTNEQSNKQIGEWLNK